MQLWLLVLLVLMARASAAARLALSAGLAGLTMAALPARLWRPQLRRLGTLALILFTFTAIGVGVCPAHTSHITAAMLPAVPLMRTSARQTPSACMRFPLS